MASADLRELEAPLSAAASQVVGNLVKSAPAVLADQRIDCLPLAVNAVRIFGPHNLLRGLSEAGLWVLGPFVGHLQ